MSNPNHDRENFFTKSKLLMLKCLKLTFLYSQKLLHSSYTNQNQTRVKKEDD